MNRFLLIILTGLIAAGAAIPALAEAAAGESLEVTVRSIDVLRKLGESED